MFNLMTWTNSLEKLKLKKMKHFTLEEFDSPDQPGSGKHMKKEFLEMIEEARDIAGIPFKINSGFRTRTHNEMVGGRVGSSHLAGCAADIHCTNSGNRIKIINALVAAGFNRIGIASSFIHCDNDITKNPALWLY
tara:strand:+ start:271 stop:675 length:405 start_codon:yes stop_codon:yes gene_type:complete